jgi:hypothetical protein
VKDNVMTSPRQVLIEGYRIDDILRLSKEHVDTLVFTGEPLVFKAGSATILGSFRQGSDRVTLELAHIDGGGEGVLPTLWSLAERYAQLHQLDHVEWVVHAINCANPNPKLRRVLVARGFTIRDVPGFGEAYYYLHTITPLNTPNT